MTLRIFKLSNFKMTAWGQWGPKQLSLLHRQSNHRLGASRQVTPQESPVQGNRIHPWDWKPTIWESKIWESTS